MSDIKAGDLVMVVRAALCCGALSGSEGKVFRVSSIAYRRKNKITTCCGQPTLAGVPGAMGCSSGKAIEFGRLKKIDPPALPESVEHRDEVPA